MLLGLCLAFASFLCPSASSALTRIEADRASAIYLDSAEDPAGLDMLKGMSEESYMATGIAAFTHRRNPIRLVVVPGPDAACALSLRDRSANSISLDEAVLIGTLMKEAGVRGGCSGEVFLSTGSPQIFIKTARDVNLWLAAEREVRILKMAEEGLEPAIAVHLAALKETPTYLIALNQKRAAYRLASDQIRIVVAVSTGDVVIRSVCAPPVGSVLATLGGFDTQNPDSLADAAVFARGLLDPIAYVICSGEAE